MTPPVMPERVGCAYHVRPDGSIYIVFGSVAGGPHCQADCDLPEKYVKLLVDAYNAALTHPHIAGDWNGAEHWEAFAQNAENMQNQYPGQSAAQRQGWKYACYEFARQARDIRDRLSAAPSTPIPPVAQTDVVGDVDEITVAKALFCASRAREQVRDDVEIGTESATFKQIEAPDEIERLWNVPPGDQWEIHRRSWISEAKTFLAALASLRTPTVAPQPDVTAEVMRLAEAWVDACVDATEAQEGPASNLERLGKRCAIAKEALRTYATQLRVSAPEKGA